MMVFRAGPQPGHRRDAQRAPSRQGRAFDRATYRQSLPPFEVMVDDRSGTPQSADLPWQTGLAPKLFVFFLRPAGVISWVGRIHLIGPIIPCRLIHRAVRI